MVKSTVPAIKKSSSLPTILIAGGAGFLGSHLAQRLLETQCKVVALDNLSTGKRSLIQELTAHPRFVFIDADINHKIPKEIESVNYIFHLAALQIHLKGPKEISFDALLTNALGTKNLLDLARRSKAKFLLASSIEVYRGLLSAESLEHYFGESWEQERRATHIEARRFAEALTWEAYEENGLDARIARLGEVFGPQMDLKSSGSLGKLIEELLLGRDLTVYGEGLEKEYYTHVDDVVRGLVKALFKEETSGKIYPLTTLEPKTPLELVYLLKELVGKEVKVVFKPPLNKTPLPELNVVDGELQHELDWEPKISLKDGLKEILVQKGIVQTGEEKELPEKVGREELDIFPHQPPTAKIEPKEPSAKRRRFPQIGKKIKQIRRPRFGWPLPRFGWRWALGITAALAFWFLIFPGASLAYSTYTARNELRAAEKGLKSLQLAEVAAHSGKAQESLENSRQHLSRLSWLFTLTRQRKTQQDLDLFLQSATFLASAVKNEAAASKPLAAALQRLLSGHNQEFNWDDLKAVSSEFSQAQEDALLAEAYLKKIDQPTNARLSAYTAVLGDAVARFKELAPLISIINKEAPRVLGADSSATYLLLFQNSSELRPTGGFIGSYGKLVLKSGRIDELLVDDVYNLDGILETKGIEVEPPPPLKEHLGVSRLLVRDANWDPDFPQTVEQIETLYNLAKEEQIDGVVAVDLTTIEKLLEVIGPVYLAQFNETITKDNFFEKTEFYSEADYYPGSPQKKTFLSLLAAKLLENMLRTEPANFSSLAQAAKILLEEKHILVSYPEGDLHNVLREKNWDGQLIAPRGDYLMVVDANLGATKANYYVKRSYNYAVKNIDRQGTLEGVLTLNYIHGAASNSWPGGAYKNYVRIFVPEGSVLKKTVLSSEGVDSKDLDITESVNQGVSDGKTVWGSVFTLNAGKTLSLTFTYDLPESLALKPDEKSYSLYVQKQPGTVADPLTVDFLTPFGRTIIGTPKGSERTGNLWRWSGSLRKDVRLDFLLK
jgi:nucleoside-diphosphate-sugar epimerase